MSKRCAYCRRDDLLIRGYRGEWLCTRCIGAAVKDKIIWRLQELTEKEGTVRLPCPIVEVDFDKLPVQRDLHVAEWTEPPLYFYMIRG